MDSTTELRKQSDFDAYLRDCPAFQVLNLVADKWTLLVVGALDSGTLRYGQLSRRLDGISPKMLSQTLRKLERHGLLVRTQYPTIPPQVEYTLTPLAKNLCTLLTPVKEWAEEHTDQILAAKQEFDNRKPAQPWHGTATRR
jgi:DNA-binding HxlR family transcriptional regulator